jgi:hypothetical protein
MWHSNQKFFGVFLFLLSLMLSAQASARCVFDINEQFKLMHDGRVLEAHPLFRDLIRANAENSRETSFKLYMAYRDTPDFLIELVLKWPARGHNMDPGDLLGAARGRIEAARAYAWVIAKLKSNSDFENPTYRGMQQASKNSFIRNAIQLALSNIEGTIAYLKKAEQDHRYPPPKPRGFFERLFSWHIPLIDG